MLCNVLNVSLRKQAFNVSSTTGAGTGVILLLNWVELGVLFKTEIVEEVDERSADEVG